jgi:hypothetical protein
MILSLARILFLTILCCCLFANVKAQSFAGYHNSNYAGIYGVLSNPASAAGSRYKWDVNIVGVDVKGGNTYLSIPPSVLFNKQDTFRRNYNYFLDTAATRKQNGWGTAEVLMPSALYAIDEKQTVAFTWRIRSAGNLGNINPKTANFFGLDFPNPVFNNNHFSLEQGAVSAHLWNEFGFTYSRVIKDDMVHRWKAGATIKYLSGIAAAYAVVNNANFTMHSPSSGSISSGTMHYAYNSEADYWEQPYLSNFKLFENPGVGLDVGMIYEWRPDGDGFGAYNNNSSYNPDADEYKLRLGVSITDIGGIMYDKAKVSADLDLTRENINPNELKVKKKESPQQYARRMIELFTPLESKDKFYMTLPTALHVMADYNIDGRFFINANAVVAITSGKKDYSKTYMMTQLQLTPRFDSKHFGAYLPLVINKNGQADAGIGIRIGPLLIGSNSIFSNLFRERIDHADAFVALRVIPIHFNRKDRSGGGRKGRLDCPTNL